MEMNILKKNVCHLCSMAVEYIIILIMMKTTICAVALMLSDKTSPLGFNQEIKTHLHHSVLYRHDYILLVIYKPFAVTCIPTLS